MKQLLLGSVLVLFSNGLMAKECVGIKKCVLDFAVATNSEVLFDKKINFNNVSLLETNLQYEDKDFENNLGNYLKKNFFSFKALKPNKYEIKSLREDIYNYAPIVLVTREEGIPPFINPNGEVTLVYYPKKEKLNLDSKSINKSLQGLKIFKVENSNVIAIGGVYEKVSQAMISIVKEDIK